MNPIVTMMFVALGAAIGPFVARALTHRALRRRSARARVDERLRRRGIAERLARSNEPRARSAGLAWLDEIDRQAER